MIPVIIRMIYKLALLFAVFSTMFTIKTEAQVWELGFQVGGAGYMGDLNPTNPLKISGHSAGLFVRANLDPNWGLSLNYTNGSIAARDSKSSNIQFQKRNLSFSNNLNELSLLVDFNFFDYFAGGGFRSFSPYLYTGIAGVIFNPTTEYNGVKYELPLYQTETKAYKTYALALPLGIGVKYRVGENWSLVGNIGYRTAYTDYLDDVSGNYPDPADYSNDPSIKSIQIALSDRSGELGGQIIGAKGVQRGDFRKRDTYMFVGIGITYTFVSQKCF